jgi:hypothetical protein
VHRGGATETVAFAVAWLSVEAAGLKLPCTEGSDLWLSDQIADRDEAAILCKSCPIKAQCLTAALARHEDFGVWGMRDLSASWCRDTRKGAPRSRGWQHDRQGYRS